MNEQIKSETASGPVSDLTGLLYMSKDLAELNRREPKPAMIIRLLAEAQAGKLAGVSIADALEFRRDQYGLTQSEFASILGMQKSHYNEVVNGKRRLPIVATKRAFAIGVPAEILLQPDV